MGSLVNSTKYLRKNNANPFRSLTTGGTSLVVQWVRLHAPNAGGPGSTLVRELDPTCMLQLRVHMPQLRSPHVTTKSPHATTKEPKTRN